MNTIVIGCVIQLHFLDHGGKSYEQRFTHESVKR